MTRRESVLISTVTVIPEVTGGEGNDCVVDFHDRFVEGGGDGKDEALRLTGGRRRELRCVGRCGGVGICRDTAR